MPDEGIELPRLPEAKFITIGDYKNAYFVVGSQDGRPLMLCHGLGANSLQFVDDAAFFAARGYRVIVPDLRGHGRSTCPYKRSDEDFSLQRLAADLIAILDAENIETIDWVGNSLGGILGLSLMKTDQHRLGKFISFGTSYSLSTPPFLVPVIKAVYRLFGRELLAKISAPATSSKKVAREIIYTMLAEIDVDAVVRIVSHIAEYDLIANAESFSRPVLIIRGSNDRAVNKALKPTLSRMAKCAHFQLVKLDDAGHCTNLDQPAKIRQIILDFLAD